MNSMKFRLFALLFALFPLAAASAADATPAPTPRPSILDRLLHPFGGPKKKEDQPEVKGTEIKGTHFKHLSINMTVEPKVLKLSETRELKATVTLANHGTQLLQMEFPTSQRIEVVIKTKAGKLVEQWSEDQAFVNEPSLVTINPNERVEYVATMATRDLVAGESYVLEAFFPNYDTMRTQLPLVPQK
jgi:hypothetical protein